MIVSLTGTNSYLIKRRADELVAGFVKKYGGLALERIDAEESDFQAILDAVQGVPFLSERKMVVVRSLSANKPAAEQIEQIISSIPESTDFIIYEPITDKRTVYYKSLKSQTKLEDYAELDSRELAKWLVSEAKLQGGSLQIGDANFLVDRVGTNQAMLANELDKLLLYEPKITRANINLLTEPTPQSKIFELLDAAFGGDKNTALKLYAEQRAQKVEPQAVLAMIAWQLRMIAVASHAGSKRPDEVAKDTGANIYPINKAFSMARKLEITQLESMVSDALDIDYRGKTTSLDMDEALKTYIVTL